MGIDLIQKTFSSLKYRNFRLFFTGQAISLIGTWIHQTAIGWLIYDLTNSKFLLGFIMAMSTLPGLLLSLLGGVIADKYSKKETILITQTLSMLLVTVLAGLILFKVTNVWYITVITTLMGVVFAIDMPVRQSFFAEIVKKQDLMNAIALNSSIVNLARIIGPAFAGIIMVKFGIQWCFILNAFSFIAVLYALFLIKIPKKTVKQQTEPVNEFIKSGFQYAINNKMILYLMILMIIMGIFGWSYAVLFPVIAKDIFHQGEKGYATLVSANGAGAFIGTLIVAYIGNSPKNRNLVTIGIYLFALMVILLAFCSDYRLSLLITAFAGMGIVMYFSSTTTLIQANLKDSIRGRVMGIWALLFSGMVPIGSFLSGTLAQYIGMQKTLLLSASICIISVTLLNIIMQNSFSQEIQEESIIL